MQMAVVKADAYGHGAVPVSRTALAAGAEWLGVALVDEGAELRAAGIAAPVLVMGNLLPEDVEEALRHDLAVAVYARETALALEERAAAASRSATVHVKVDTGMGRLGVHPDETMSFVEWLQGLRHVRLEGIFSHFATADETDLSFAREQLNRFRGILEALENRGVRIPVQHMANTAGTMNLPHSHLNLIRTGIGIYGLYPSPDVPRSPLLEPAMSLVTRITHLKQVPPGTPLSYGRTYVTRESSWIATLPVGYGDGYPRLLSNRGSALVGGVRVPIVGRVCMDMTLVDVSRMPEARVGDEAVLFGRQGQEEIHVDEIAELTGTINYEVTCNVGKRVPRQHV